MAGKLNPKKRKRRKPEKEKERLGKITVEKKGGLTIYHVQVNPPKAQRLTRDSRPRKK